MTQKYQMKNGLTVLLVESHKSPVVSVQMWVHTGSADEQKGEEGISHFIEHLVFKGTRKYRVGEIASTIEGAGGELNAYTSFDQTVFYVTISKAFVETGLETISEMMGFPQFDAKEIDNEREVVIEEIKRSNDSVHRQASRVLFSTAFSQHPYGIPVIGYADNIRRVTRDELVDYYHRRYVPRNMTLVIVGDFESKEMKKLVETYYDGFEDFELKEIERKSEPQQTGPKIKVEKANFEESVLHLAWRIPQATHEDIPALDVLSTILGQGDSSRLMRSLRLEKPLTNYAVSSTFTPKDVGFFAISVSYTQTLEPILEELLPVLSEILSSAVSNQELAKALINFESDELYSLETVDGMARKFGTYEHLFGDHEYYKQFMQQVNELKAEDLLRVARKYLAPEMLTVALLSPTEEETTSQNLEAFVEKYDKLFRQALKKSVSQTEQHKRKQLKWQFAPGKDAGSIEEIVLPSGAKVLLRSTHDTPVVSVRVAALGGLRREPENLTGLTELMSRAWAAGTSKLSEAEIHEIIDSSASSLSAFGGRNTAGLSMTSLSPLAEGVFDLFGETLVDPGFSAEVIEREKHLMVEQIRTRNDNPARVAILSFMKEMFSNHPYSRDPLGDTDTLKDISRDDIANHYQDHICAPNLTFVIAGDFERKKWVDKIDTLTHKIQGGERFNKKLPLTPLSEDKLLYSSSNKEQSHLVVGFPGLTFVDNDRYALQVMQSILAGQGGRLFLELRDKASLAYSVSPLRMEGIEPGYFGAYIGCSPEKVSTAMEMMQIEFSKLVDTEVSEDELVRAQRYLVGRHDIELQRTSAVGAAILFDDIYGLSFEEPFKFAEAVQAVTVKDVRHIAERLFSQNKVVSLVGPSCPWPH